ncbi:MAG: insulinase family protein [Rhodospirillaceae bacterium]|nr:insulinase family protein [Rhodospirillaceae bacterium]
MMFARIVCAAALLFSTAAGAVTVKEVKSPGGLTAYLSEDHTVPIIAVSFLFNGGSALDPADKVGLSTLATSTIDEGAGPLDSFAFQSELQDKAISLRFDAAADDIRGRVVTTTPNAARAFELLHLALTQPRFDAEPVERIRRELLVGILSRDEDPSSVAQEKLWSTIFGNHPYARNEDGTENTMKAITVADLRAWVKSRFARDRVLIAVSGDITPADLGKAMDQIFGALPATTGLNATVPPAPVSTKGQVVRVTKNLPQTVIYIGQKGILRSDPDWYIATVVDYVFGGGGFQSRLMDEVREKRGLAYGVSTALVPYDAGAMMFAQVGTRADQAETSLKIIRDEWKKMHDAGPTEEELKTAKLYLTGAWPLRFTSTQSIAEMLLAVQKDKLGIDYLDKRNSLIEAVTLDDAKRLARRLYDPEGLTVVMVGPAPKAPK